MSVSAAECDELRLSVYRTVQVQRKYGYRMIPRVWRLREHWNTDHTNTLCFSINVSDSGVTLWKGGVE